MIFVGDAIFPGGNDYPAKQAGVQSIRVRDPDETKRVIEAVCACLERQRAFKPPAARLPLEPAAGKTGAAKSGRDVRAIAHQAPDQARRWFSIMRTNGPG